MQSMRPMTTARSMEQKKRKIWKTSRLREGIYESPRALSVSLCVSPTHTHSATAIKPRSIRVYRGGEQSPSTLPLCTRSLRRWLACVPSARGFSRAAEISDLNASSVENSRSPKSHGDKPGHTTTQLIIRLHLPAAASQDVHPPPLPTGATTVVLISRWS